MDNTKSIGIPELINDANQALNAGAVFSAFTMALSLVATCSVVEYPDEWFQKNAANDPYIQLHFPKCNPSAKNNHDRERFEMWYDDWRNNHRFLIKKIPSEKEKIYFKRMKNCQTEMKTGEMIWRDFRESNGGEMPIMNGELLYQMRCKMFHTCSNQLDTSKIKDEGNKDIAKFVYSTELNNSGFWCTKNNNQKTYTISLYGLTKELLYFVEIYYQENKNKNSFPHIQVQVIENVK